MNAQWFCDDGTGVTPFCGQVADPNHDWLGAPALFKYLQGLSAAMLSDPRIPDAIDADTYDDGQVPCAGGAGHPIHYQVKAGGSTSTAAFAVDSCALQKDVVATAGTPDPGVVAALTAVGQALAGAGIGVGDVMYSNGALPHIGIIVGWGAFTADRTKIFPDQGNPASRVVSLQTSRSDAAPIPYIVDHGPHGVWASAKNYALPRPFYVQHWRSLLEFSQTSVAGDWYFLRVPRTVIFSPGQLQNPPSRITMSTLAACAP
jgi:hypothetical protein